MRKRTNLNRILTLAGFVAAGLLTTACGGGGSASAVPAAKPPVSSGAQKMAQGHVTAVIPAATTPQGHLRSPKYLNTSDPNSAITVSVTPSDPAEAAQWTTLYGTTGFTICFNLYTAGVVNAALNPVPVPGGVQVSFPMPTPPGNDVFLITQYDGQCSATNPYIAPVPNPNANGNGVLSQAPPVTVNINPGITNNFNVQLTACTPPQGTNPTTCSNATPPPGTPPTTVQLGAAVAAVYLAGSSPAPKSLAAPIPIPIQQPIREQAQFLAAGSHVGVPVPIVALDSAGFVVAGSPATGSGALPKAGDKLTLSHTETGPSGAVTGHAKLYLIDATTGAVAQTEAPGAPITLTQLNALDAADAVSGGTVGDPYVVVLSTDGSNAKGFLSSTVTLNATLNGAAIPAQTTTFAEQGAIYTAFYGPPGSGYPDAGGPILGADQILNTIGSGLPAAAQGLWVVNGGSMSEVGVGKYPVAGGLLNLHGAAFDANPSVNAIFVADIGATLGSLQTAPASNATASGLYMFDPVAHTSFPVAVQFQQSNSYIGFQNPQAVAYIPGGYLYVEESNRIWAIDPQSNGAGTGLTTVTNGGTTYIQAEAIGQVPVPAGGIQGGPALGLSFIGIAPNTLLFADPGNQQIASINASTGAVTSLATGARFAGLSPGPTAGTYYACSLEGQLYKIASGTATSFGLPIGTYVDGPVGVGAAIPFAAPSPYAVQGTTANFFGSASTPTLPYTVAPFAAAGPVFAAAAQAAVAGGVLKFAPDTSAQNIGTAQSGLIDECSSVVYVTAAMAGANPGLTPESFLFTDRGVLRTLVP